MKNKIYISDEQKDLTIDLHLKHVIRDCINKTLQYMNMDKPCEVSVLFCTEQCIKQLNAQFRAIDNVTDVLSFANLDDNNDVFEQDEIVLGDIVICTKRAMEQAVEYNHSIIREIAFLCVHSMLHLLGYDHVTSKEDEEEMFKLQDEILLQLNILR